MWWSRPKVYLRIIIYLAVLSVVWIKLKPIMRMGDVPVESGLSDVVEGYFYEDSKAGPGMKYVSVGFYLEATGPGELTLDEEWLRFVARSGRVFPPVEGSLSLPELKGSRWRFEPGEVCIGRAVFLVPEEIELASLSINPPR
ncbi:hypothetical protein ACFLT7_08665 [candidate division KSB1 bacterium]